MEKKIKANQNKEEIYLRYLGKKYSISIEKENEDGKFLENDIDMNESLTDEDERINKSKFINIIKSETNNYINKRFDQIIFLAGAGASITGYKNNDRLGRSMNDIAEYINKSLSKNDKLYTLKEISELCHYRYILTDDEFNLEELISDILAAEEYISDELKDKYRETRIEIFSEIKKLTKYKDSKKILRHDAIIKILSDKLQAPNRLTIATTNYDTLFEDAADINNYTIIDGFTFESTPHFDADEFEWNLVKDVPNISTDQLEYKKQVINLIKLHGSLTWETPNKKGEKIYKKNKRSITKPLMIFPNSNKYMLSYTEPYFDLFSKFQELINRKNTLLIVNGFSFGDSHISQMIHHAITHNGGLTLLITDYNITREEKESDKSEGWKNMELLMDAGYPIMFLKATMRDLDSFISGVN